MYVYDIVSNLLRSPDLLFNNYELGDYLILCKKSTESKKKKKCLCGQTK